MKQARRGDSWNLHYTHVFPRIGGTTTPSSEVVASMVSSQLQSEAQFSSSTPVDSDVPIDPLMLKIVKHLSDPYVCRYHRKLYC